MMHMKDKGQQCLRVIEKVDCRLRNQVAEENRRVMGTEDDISRHRLKLAWI